MQTTFTAMIHGEPGVGKSRLGDTAPAPRLILDSEGRAKYLPSQPKVYWDPMTQAPPVNDGTWETCVVAVPNVIIFNQAFQWLRSGQHPFRSVIVDSIMEVQKRIIDEVSGTDQLTTPDWGVLLRRLEKLVRDYRDLTLVESNGVQVVVFTCGSSQRDGKYHPHLQGQMRDTMPYYLDLVGYLFVQPDADGNLVRRLLTAPHPQFIAKDGTDALPSVIDNPNLGVMFAQIEQHANLIAGVVQ